MAAQARDALAAIERQAAKLNVPLKIAGEDWTATEERGRLVELAPAGSELWLDGGHNPDGGRAIAAALADLEERVSRPLVLIVGMLASKDCAGFLGNFTGLARRRATARCPAAAARPRRRRSAGAGAPATPPSPSRFQRRPAQA